MKFGRKTWVNPGGKIATILYPYPCPRGGVGGLKTLKAEGNT